MPATLDHILLGVSDLNHGIAWFEQLSGVQAVLGGIHPKRGTRNTLLGLGPQQYLEIIAPDPQQAGSPASREPWAARLIALQEPRLVGWAAYTNDLAGIVKMATAAGISIEEPRDGSRARTDGALLRWKSFSLKDDHDGLLPFLIEWSRESIHPSQDSPSGCRLLHFSAESPSAERIAFDVQKLDLPFDVKPGERSRFHARILAGC